MKKLEDSVTRFLHFLPELSMLCRPPEEIRELGVSLQQAKVLEYLALYGTKTMSRIAERFNISLPSTTELVGKLVSSGYLKRITDKKDRRIVKIKLTAKAEGISDDIIKLCRQNIRDALKKLDADERNSLIRYLEKMLFEEKAP